MAVVVGSNASTYSQVKSESGTRVLCDLLGPVLLLENVWLPIFYHCRKFYSLYGRG